MWEIFNFGYEHLQSTDKSLGKKYYFNIFPWQNVTHIRTQPQIQVFQTLFQNVKIAFCVAIWIWTCLDYGFSKIELVSLRCECNEWTTTLVMSIFMTYETDFFSYII